MSSIATAGQASCSRSRSSTCASSASNLRTLTRRGVSWRAGDQASGASWGMEAWAGADGGRGRPSRRRDDRARPSLVAAPARARRTGRAGALPHRAPAHADAEGRVRAGLAARDGHPGTGQPRGPRERAGRQGVHLQHRAGGRVHEAERHGHRRWLQGRALRRRRRPRLRLLRHDAAVPDATSWTPRAASTSSTWRTRPSRCSPTGSSPRRWTRRTSRSCSASKRGLLAAVAGNLATNVGMIDVYDISQDCRHPVLKSSTPVGFLGHESGMAPDGRTFYSASPSSATLVAVDISNPSLPRPDLVRQLRLARALDQRRRQPRLRRRHRLGADHPRHLRGPGAGPEPDRARGRPPAVGLDEHPAERHPRDDQGASLPRRDRRVRRPVEGGRRAHHRHRGRDASRRVVSNLRLEVHQPENFPALANDNGRQQPRSGLRRPLLQRARSGSTRGSWRAA